MIFLTGTVGGRNRVHLNKNSDTAVLLIIPPSPFLLDERVFPNLGVLHVARALEKNGNNVSVLDLSGVAAYRKVLKECLVTSSFSRIGISATTPQMPHVRNITKIIRAEQPAVRIILGGPHVTLIHSAAVKEKKRDLAGRARNELDGLLRLYDVVVSGDGEKAILAAVDEHAPSFIDANRRDAEFYMSKSEIESAPLPARHLIDLESYHYFIDEVRATSLIGQLGCPFSCGFCGGRESPCFRVPRIRTTGKVIDEIEYLFRRYGFTGYMFYDDELNVNPHFCELLDALILLQRRLGREFRFRGFVKAELFNEAQAEKMYAAGFRWILSGFESGAPRILTTIRKRATREDNTRCCTTAHKHGLKVKALMSLGHPGESSETIAATEEWLLRSRPDDIDVTVITPYPGTRYYDDAVPVTGQKGKTCWIYKDAATGDRLMSGELDFSNSEIYYKGDPALIVNAPTWTDYLSGRELAQMRYTLYNDVRKELGITIEYKKARNTYDHSMGQSNPITDSSVKTA